MPLRHLRSIVCLIHIKEGPKCPRDSHRPYRNILICLTAFLLLAGYYFYSRTLCGLEDYCPVAALEAGPGRVIKISKAMEWEVTRPFYYEVEVGGRVVVPRTYMTGCCRRQGAPEFGLLFSEDRDLVGVVWAERPGVLLLLHDFSTGENWPMSEGHDAGEKGSDMGSRLRDRLRADHPHLRPELSWRVS